MKHFILITICLLATTFKATGQLSEQAIADLDKYIEEARLTWKVPGLSVAIVKDGKVVLSKGYGVKNLDSRDPVDPQTLFAMASTTKAMTAACLAMLVDEGKLDWDDPVIKHLPEFRVKDPFVTRDIRVRDMLTHNTGIGNADFLWVGNDLSSVQILERMENAPMSYPLRGGYTYQNIMYLVAGQIIERVSRKSWDEFIRERIMSPLHMENTYPLQEMAFQHDNRSTPHSEVDGKIITIKDTDADMIGPAGSGWSCVDDMAKWMNFLLDSARIDGQRLISAKNFDELFSPQIVIPKRQFYSTAMLTKPFWTTYAMGWFQHDYKGMALSFHTGSLAGTIAICGLVPEEGIGVYFFGNLAGSSIRHAIMYKVVDVLTGHPNDTDWSTKFYDYFHSGDDSDEEDEDKRRMDTHPTLELSAYVGTYTHPFYDDVSVSLQKGALAIQIAPQTKATLQHWQYDTFSANYEKEWYSSDLFTFQLDEKGEVDAIMEGNSRWTKKNE